MKKLVAVLLTFLIVLSGCTVTKVETEEETDAIKFSSEYKKVDKDNNYKYVTYDNVVDTIEKGSGIIFLSYPSCVNCNLVAPVLNEVTKEKKVKEIFYYDFKDIMKNNTTEYIKLTELLKDYIGTDEDGNKKITAPTVIFVQNGNIKDVYSGMGENTDEDENKLSQEEAEALKKVYSDMVDKVFNADCDC